MKKGFVTVLTILVVLSLASTAMGITWQAFTWNGYTITMKEVLRPDNIVGYFNPEDGHYFIQINLITPQEVIDNDKLIDALVKATLLVMPDGTLQKNYMLMTTKDGIYAPVFSVLLGISPDDIELVISDAEAVEIEPPAEVDAQGDTADDAQGEGENREGVPGE